MKIYMVDGSYLDCVEIEFCGEILMVDDYRYVPIDEVKSIEE